MSNIRQGLKDRASNNIEIQRIEIARYSNKAYFPGEFFSIFLRNQVIGVNISFSQNPFI